MAVGTRVVTAVLLLAALAATAPAAGVQGATGLDEAATELREALTQASVSKKAPVKVLVLDFVDAKGFRSRLGARLADEIADRLENQPGFSVINRQTLRDAVARDKVPAKALQAPGVLACYSDELSATFLVEGELRVRRSEYELNLGAALTGLVKKRIFGQKFRSKMTEEEKALGKQRASFPPDPPREIGDITLPEQDARGYPMPQCASCQTTPGSSHHTTKAKFQGAVLLKAQIDPDGHASHVEVVEGLPCGLNKKAIETVSEWRFKPIVRTDGQPAGVTVPIEVTFRLY